MEKQHLDCHKNVTSPAYLILKLQQMSQMFQHVLNSPKCKNNMKRVIPLLATTAEHTMFLKVT
eukprot:8549362-Ditylum_brightwellii.AAC.1